MAVIEFKVFISQLVGEQIATKFWRLKLGFGGPAIQRRYRHHCANYLEVENNPRWRPLNRKYLYISLKTWLQPTFDGYTYAFGVQQSNGAMDITVRTNRKWKIIHYDGRWTGSSSASRDTTFPHRRRPSWISHFRFGCTIFQVFPLYCWSSKMRG